MYSGNQYTYINTATTTILGPAANRRVNVQGIFVNKTLTGTMTFKNGATTIGSFAIGTPVGTYWLSSGFGVECGDFQLVTSAADDITVAWNTL